MIRYFFILLMTLAMARGAEWSKYSFDDAKKQWGALPENKVLAAAEGGDRFAQFYLGRKFHDARQHVQAIEWYKKAAEQHLLNAQNNMAVIYMSGGLNVRKDLERAIELLEEIAAFGDPMYLNNLGAAYLRAQRFDDAVVTLEKAAAKGYTAAMKGLGDLYHKEGPYFNPPKGIVWYRKAAEGGEVTAMAVLGTQLAQNASTKEEGKEWLRKAAKGGVAGAADMLEQIEKNAPGYRVMGGKEDQEEAALAERYENGDGVPKNIELARAMYIRLGTWTAISNYKLGPMYEHGRVVERDDERAIDHYWRAFEMNQGARKDESGANFLRMLAAGRSKWSKAEIAQKLEWMKPESPRLEFLIGKIFEEGKVVRMDLVRAVASYTKAADAGSAEAQNSLGELWAEGVNDSQPDFAEAAQWFQLAAAQGHAKAAQNLLASKPR